MITHCWSKSWTNSACSRLPPTWTFPQWDVRQAVSLCLTESNPLLDLWLCALYSLYVESSMSLTFWSAISSHAQIYIDGVQSWTRWYCLSQTVPFLSEVFIKAELSTQWCFLSTEHIMKSENPPDGKLSMRTGSCVKYEMLIQEG